MGGSGLLPRERCALQAWNRNKHMEGKRAGENAADALALPDTEAQATMIWPKRD